MDLLGIPGFAIAAVTSGGLSVFGIWAVWAVLTGRLVTLREHSELRAAYTALDERNDALAGQVGELLELARTGNALMQGVQSAAQQARRTR